MTPRLTAVQDVGELLSRVADGHPSFRAECLAAIEVLQQDQSGRKAQREDLASSRQRTRELEAEAERLKSRLDAPHENAAPPDDLQAMAERIEWLTGQLEAVRTDVRTHPDYLALTSQLEAIKAKIHRPRFWTAAFAEAFAESLAAMDKAHQPLEVALPEEIAHAFQQWHQDHEAALDLFLTSGFNADLAEELRRDLICQWVYFRWLELSDHLGRP